VEGLKLKSLLINSLACTKIWYLGCLLYTRSKRATPESTTNLKEEDTKMDIMKRLWQEEEGQDLVEYGLLVVLISLFAIVAMKGLAGGISDAFSNASAQLTT
jgi:pilus assembly protein Flp/PilA